MKQHGPDSIVVGVDVGGPTKGFHAVALQEGHYRCPCRAGAGPAHSKPSPGRAARPAAVSRRWIECPVVVNRGYFFLPSACCSKLFHSSRFTAGIVLI